MFSLRDPGVFCSDGVLLCCAMTANPTLSSNNGWYNGREGAIKTGTEGAIQDRGVQFEFMSKLT